MITLMFREYVKVPLVKGKFVLKGEKMKVSDISIVRYRIKNANITELIEYVKENQKKFIHSGHVIEIDIKDAVSTLGAICSALKGVVVYICINITREIMKDGEFDLHEYEKDIKDISLVDSIYRVIIREDDDVGMTSDVYNKIKNVVCDWSGVKNISVCNSPLTFFDTCCINATTARDIMARCVSPENVLKNEPTANQEKIMDSCGCVAYTEVYGGDITAVVGKVAADDEDKTNGNKSKQIKNKTKYPRLF